MPERFPVGVISKRCVTGVLLLLFLLFFTPTWTSYLFPEALLQTTGSCHISSLLLIGFIFFDPRIIDPTDFRGATVICQIIAHYQAVLIL